MVALSLFNHFASPPSESFFCILSFTCGLLVLALPCFHRSPCWMNAFSSRPFHDRFFDSFGRKRKLKRHVAHAFVLHLGWNVKRLPSTHHTCVRLTPLPPIERTDAILSRSAPYHALASHRRQDHLVCSSSCSPSSSEIGFSPSPSLLAPLNSTSLSIPLSPSTFYTPRSTLPSLSFLSAPRLRRSFFRPPHAELASPSACSLVCLPLSRLSSLPPLFFTLDPSRSDGLRM